MNWKEFEQQLRSGAGQHESEIDTDRLWKAIKQKKRRKRALFWWWGGGIGALLLGGSALLYHHYTTHHSRISDTDNLSTISTPFRKDTEGRSADTAQLVVTKHQVTPYGTLPHAVEQAKTRSGRQSAAPTFAAKQAQPSVHSVPALPNMTPSRPSATGASTAWGESHQAETPTTGAAPSQQVSKALTADMPDNSALHPNGQQAFNLPLALLPLDTMPIVPPQRRPLLLTYPPAEKNKAPLPVKWYVEAQAGIGLWSGNRPVNIESDTGTLLASNNRITNLEAIQGQFTFGVPLHSAWSIRVGASYSRFNAVLRLDTSYVNPYTPDSAIVQMANGTSFDTTVFYRTVTHRKVRQYNRVTAFQVPITLSWTPRGQGRWAYAPYAGVRLNFQQRAQGHLLNEKQQLVAAPYAQNYRKTFGLTAEAGCQLIWRYSPNLQLVLSAYGAHDITSRSVRSQERFGQAGVGVGVRKTFR